MAACKIFLNRGEIIFKQMPAKKFFFTYDEGHCVGGERTLFPYSSILFWYFRLKKLTTIHSK